jgi:peptidoglycan/xylan/chitin deacetylase (PgdA/CDA1 family)
MASVLIGALAFWIGCSNAVGAGAAGEASGQRPKKMPWSEMQQRYQGAFVLSAGRQTKRVALTFDDVPDPRYTPKVLDVLKRKGVRATFFVVGTRARKHPDLVRRIRKEGHAIGNHSYSHPDFSRLSLGAMQEQIRKAEERIAPLAGFRPRLIRPPYGEILAQQLEWTRKAGYTVVNWDVDSSDWRQLTASQVFRNVTRAVRPGSVVLLHAGGGEGQRLSGTVQALPRIIDWLRDHGYDLVTLPELLAVPETLAVSGQSPKPPAGAYPGGKGEERIPSEMNEMIFPFMYGFAHRPAPFVWTSSRVELNRTFRALWEQHVYWTRLTVDSIAGRLPDEAPTTARLLRNADDLGAVFRPYYGPQVAKQFAGLVRTHLTIAAELVTALRDGQKAKAEDANKRWYANADDIARFLGRINPYWSEAEWRFMYREHLRLLTEEVTTRLAGKYKENVATGDPIEKQALGMADVFTIGIIRQFPGMFAA